MTLVKNAELYRKLVLIYVRKFQSFKFRKMA